MKQHRAWQRDLSTKLQLKQAAIAALPPELQAAAKVRVWQGGWHQHDTQLEAWMSMPSMATLACQRRAGESAGSLLWRPC